MLFAFQVVMSIAFVAAIFFAWPNTRPTERIISSASADSIRVRAADSVRRAATLSQLDSVNLRDSARVRATAARRDSTASVAKQQEDMNAVRAFLVIVLAAGALGTLFRGVGSLAWYVGTRTLRQSWLLTYYVGPLKGALLGLLFFFVFRAGLLATNTPIGDSNPAGFAALAALVGLFDREGTRKLRLVAVCF